MLPKDSDKRVSYFVGEVVDVDSPYQDGSVRVRAYGLEDDKSAIPDDKLRWYKVLMPVTHGQVLGSAGSHNMLPGTKVLCMFLDAHEQIPIVLGTLTATRKDNG